MPDKVSFKNQGERKRIEFCKKKSWEKKIFFQKFGRVAGLGWFLSFVSFSFLFFYSFLLIVASSPSLLARPNVSQFKSLKNPLINIFEIRRIRLSTDFGALTKENLWSVGWRKSTKIIKVMFPFCLPVYVMLYPTKPFTILEPQNSPIDSFEQNKS